ncbi:MAG: L-serine ammonia-lyase, partial [Planctomycetota bacterium]
MPPCDSAPWSLDLICTFAGLPIGLEDSSTEPRHFPFDPQTSMSTAASAISVFDLFKIGIGPSSSHTVGPMVAAHRFSQWVQQHHPADAITGLRVDLYGSLALTGIGHRTDRAIVAGLQGAEPESVDPQWIESTYAEVERSGRLPWLGRNWIAFDLHRDLVWHRGEFLPEHSNAMRFTALSGDSLRAERLYFSIGGGFVVDQQELARGLTSAGSIPNPSLPFDSAAELLELCQRHHLSIAEIVLRNELTVRNEQQIASGLDRIWETMQKSIETGCTSAGILPGGLGIRRRAPDIYKKLHSDHADRSAADDLALLDWVDMFALAVNEENAAGGRVVTAPTNGAAGIIPAVLSYYARFM